MVDNLLVVVPVINQPGWTSLIVHELLVKTANPAVKLMIDNGSTDGRTIAFLDGIDGKSGFEVLRNAENKGVSGAWNQGIDCAIENDMEYLAILNNDLTLPHNWDDILIDELRGDVMLSSFSTVKNINIFAPFCFMAKTELFKKLGHFSEEFGKYCFEEIDFMIRMKKEGIRFKNLYADNYPDFFHAGCQSAGELFETDVELRVHLDAGESKLKAKYADIGNIRDFLHTTVMA